MNETLIRRVKNSLNLQFYTMNDSWLADCIEYYLDDHENPTQDEIITFVINQWVLSDLRDINNDNGCLPKNLANQKCTTLPGKYILQMDKIYDISTSKYKQLEKIRNVSSENVEATENENAKQEDKFQAWEPKSKRMLQLFLTDGVQDVLAIEYKPIRFLKDNLYPGFKLMVKGPVICRRGMILLEEINLSEVGGEVDSLLIVNAVENVFARALNLEENPDPYNDNNKQTRNTQNTQEVVQIEDDFDMDSEVIDQIEKQMQQGNSNDHKSSVTSVSKNQQRQISVSIGNASNIQVQNTITLNKFQNLTTSTGRSQEMQSENTFNINTNVNKAQKQSNNYNIQSKVTKFEDDDDSFLEMVDEKAFENLFTPTTTVQHKSNTNKQSTSSRSIQNQNTSDFPMEDELYDLTEEHSPFFNASNPQNAAPNIKSSLFTKPSTNKTVPKEQKILYKSDESEQRNSVSKNVLKDTKIGLKPKNLPWVLPSPLKSTVIVKPCSSKASDFPDYDFDLGDFDLQTNDSKVNFTKSTKVVTNNANSSQASSSSSLKLKNINVKKMDLSPFQTNNTKISTDTPTDIKFESSSSLNNLEPEFQDEFEVEFEAMDVDFKPSITTKSESHTDDVIDNVSSMELTGVKRPASVLSPCTNAQKIRCLQSTPEDNKIIHGMITEFLSKPLLLSESIPKFCEFLCDVLEQSVTNELQRVIVRGKVVNIIKLNLLKGESGSYFHLEGTITDGTASLDIVFSSEVLEKIIGYSPQEFSQKRRQSKTNPSIKDQLREDLKKAQQTLRTMDALMEVQLKKNERGLIVNTMKLTKEQKKNIDERVQSFKK